MVIEFVCYKVSDTKISFQVMAVVSALYQPGLELVRLVASDDGVEGRTDVLHDDLLLLQNGKQGIHFISISKLFKLVDVVQYDLQSILHLTLERVINEGLF